jgi:hypothetical protein
MPIYHTPLDHHHDTPGSLQWMGLFPSRTLRMPQKFPISSLPLPPSSHILTHNLTPDPIQPSVKAFYENLKTKPSVQRRSRQLHPSSHFSYVAPLPLPFPYHVTPPEGNEEIDQAEVIENWLSGYEPLIEVPRVNENLTKSKLRKYTAKDGLRDQPRVLLAISPAGLRDCLPHLDVGDALELIGPGSLTQPKTATKSEENVARQELVDVLSGHSVLMHIPENEEEKGYAPWSLRYSGHQFGSWAGQLGDGRAISLCEFPICFMSRSRVAEYAVGDSGDAPPRRPDSHL